MVQTSIVLFPKVEDIESESIGVHFYHYMHGVIQKKGHNLNGIQSNIDSFAIDPKQPLYMLMQNHCPITEGKVISQNVGKEYFAFIESDF